MQTSITSWLKKKPPPVADTVSEQKAHSGPGSVATQPLGQGSDINNKPFSDQEDAKLLHAPAPDRQASIPPQNLPPLKQHPGLPTNVTLTSVDSKNLSETRRLIQVLLPVKYSEKFYKEILTDPVTSSVSLVALWNDEQSARPPTVVAAIRCRVLAHPPDDPDSKFPSLYISALGTYAPYRGHGLASALIRHVMATAAQDYGVTTITAHVWQANDDARALYSGLGFAEAKFEPQYYFKTKQINPPGAYLLSKQIRLSDIVGNRQFPPS